MRRSFSYATRLLFAATVSALALVACAANANTGALGGDGTSPVSAAAQGHASIRNDSGEYSGSVQDSVLGNGPADASLAQDKQVVGGVITATLGSTTVSTSIAVQTATGATLAGAEAGNVNGSVCSFSVNATYDSSTNVLSGNYQAVRGCAGESGTFSLTHDCLYPRGGLLDAVPAWNGSTGVKPNHGLHPC